ncbi:MAG: VanZ family protein [Solirubrobacterales bacterium]|nr:VanZ family protein [Solirubrobacterales bacterium]
MPKMRSRAVDAILWMLAAVLLAAIVILSLIPVNQARSLAESTSVPTVTASASASISSAVQDAAWHCLFYGPLTLTLLLAAVWRPGLPRQRSRKAALLVILGVGSLGVLLEIVQLASVGRSAEFVDLVGNVAGLAVGTGLWLGIERLSQHPSNGHERFRGDNAHSRPAVSGEGIDSLD